MTKILKSTLLCLAIVASSWCGSVLADRSILNEQIIRLHVVANSDADEDQQIKLQVRDAVIASVKADLENITDIQTAKEYLQTNLPKIEAAANEVLKNAGFSETAAASLCCEAFEKRVYDTFTLPAGVYEALRITIGEGEGQNWWCVVFPSLCIPAAGKDVSEVAASAGFTESLTAAIRTEECYKLRFFCLDMLGKMETIMFSEE